MIRNTLFHTVFIALFFSTWAGAQSFSPEDQSMVDSLNLVIEDESRSDSVHANALLELSMYYYLTNPDTVIGFCQKAKHLSERSEYLQGKSTSYGWLGYLYEDKGEIALALEYFHKGLKINQELGNNAALATDYNNIAMIYKDQQDYETAINYFRNSLNLYEETNQNQGVAGVLAWFGSIYNDLDQLDSALYYHKKSLEAYQQLENEQGIALCYDNISDLLNRQLEHLYVHNGSVDSILSLKKRALRYARISLNLRTKIGDIDAVSYSLNTLGNIYLTVGKPDSSEYYVKRSLSIAQELGYPENIKRSALLLSRVYQQKQDGAQGLVMYKLYIQMRDSINSLKNQKAAIRQQTQFEYEKQKAVDDKENEKQIALEKEKQRRQFIILMIVTIASALVLVLLIIIYRRLKITRKQKEIIGEQKHQIEEKHEEIQESIGYAKRIQTAILPPSALINTILPENFIYYLPKDIVAGDFYWLEAVDEYIFLAAADCTGHGVPGAMVSVVCHNALNRAVREFSLRKPAEILDKVRELVLITFEKSEEQMKDGMDISMIRLERNFFQSSAERTASNAQTPTTLQWAGANNPLYVVRSKDSAIPDSNEGASTEDRLLIVKGDKEPIGYTEKATSFTNHAIELSKGDMVYLFSDGYADQFGGPNGKKLGYKQFRNLLMDIAHRPMKDQHQILENYLDIWKEYEDQIDDICIVGIRI